MPHRVGRDVRCRGFTLVRRHRHAFHQLRQIRRRRPGQRLLQVTAARQRLNRRRRRLCRPLQIAARAVRLHHRLVSRRFRQVFLVFIPVFFGCVIRRPFHIAFGFRRPHRADFAFGTDNVHHLRAQLTHHLRRLQAFLLFLLVKDRAQRIIGVLHIPAQAGNILLLTGLITDNQRPVAHRRVGGAAGIAATSHRHQCRRRGQRGRFQHIRHTQRRTGAQPDTAVRHRKFGSVVDIAEAQRSGIQPVFIRGGGRADHRAVQLRVVADADVVTAFASKQPGLLLHAVKTAVHFVLTGAEVAAAGHTAKGKATARRHAGLLRVITVAVLLAFQQQVAAYVCHNALAADLRPGQARVAAAGQGNLLPGIHRSLRPAIAVAEFTAFGRVDVGEYAESGAAIAQAETDADIPAAAAVAAGHRLGVACRQQINRPGRIQLHIVGRFQLAADGGDIALTRHHANIMARI